MADKVFTSGGRIVNESGEDVGLNSTSAEVLTALGGPVEEVPVEVADIHAALVTLGLITAEPE